jgi:hypothetical protein
MPLNDLIILRRGTTTEWSNNNPILASGEPGFDLTGNLLKIGDGISSWNQLNPIGSSTNEQIDDRVSNLLVQGSGIKINYNDPNNSLTVSFSGIDLGTYPLITISAQPVNITGYFDENLTFSVTASSSLPTKPIYYQWAKSIDNINYTNINNANNASLTFNTSTIEDNSYYRCLLTSDLSFKYTNVVTLTVSQRPSAEGQSYVYEKNSLYSWH